MAGDKPDASSLNFDKPYNNINIKTYVPLVLDLDELNYDAWKELFQTHCRGFGVLGYINGTILSSGEDDHEWQRLDSLVKLWIYGTISYPLLTMVLKPETSAHDAWVCLESLFRERKEAWAIQLGNDLHNITHGDETISDYCQRIKSISDLLVNINYPVDEKTLVTYMVNGLTEHFIHVATIIRHQTPLPSFLQARSMLVLEEQRLSRDGNYPGHKSSVTMAESSDARDVSLQKEDLEYMHASNVNVSDFVSVKFSKRNFPVWQQQMLCLMKSKMMDGMVKEDDTAWRRDKSYKIIEKYQILLKGWILGTLNEQVLQADFYNLSPMEIWEKLKDSYGSTNLGNQTDTTFKNRYIERALENSGPDIKKDRLKMKFYDAALEGSWWRAKSILKNHKEAATEEISTHGNTMLHLAVREGHNYFVEKLLNFIKDGELTEKVNDYGYTPLHIAAKFDNIDAAKLLVEKRKNLLYIPDHKSIVPLMIAFEERQLNTFLYLSEVTESREEYLFLRWTASDSKQVRIAVDLLTKAICTKQYDLAMKLMRIFPPRVRSDYEVLMALIKNFPSELGFGEALICPSLKYICRYIVKRSSFLFYSLEYSYTMAESTLWSLRLSKKYYNSWLSKIIMILIVPIAVLYPIYQLILLLILVLLFPLFILYLLLWNAFAFLVPPIKHIKKTKKEFREAKVITRMISTDHQHSDHEHYQLKKPILEAACLDAYTVFREFLHFSYDPMTYLTEEGHNIMQLAVKNRSNKVYKLIRSLNDATEYNIVEDTFGNNLMHLAGQLPPSVILRCTTGAALQLQRELQWFEEVASHVEHRLLTERNSDDETLEMVFTREHSELVKEGENWMKTTAESCSITTALIVTIVFAAAITVPGGSNQETGIPLFKKHIAFTIFAVSDAISLFTGATSLSVFLSILTTRFAEKDFLVVLPRRLLIGLFLLLISTTAMMVAFSTILFLVFCDQIQWMLGPIGALACMPIAAIVFLQFPLMFDLFKSTYFPIFGKEQRKRSFSKEE